MALCWARGSRARVPPGPVAGVGGCVGSTLGCASHGGFTACLHALFSAGRTGAETSDVSALASQEQGPCVVMQLLFQLTSLSGSQC